MRSRVGMLALGAVALVVVIGAGAFAKPASLGADGCPPDRDVMAFGLTHAEDDAAYERLSEAVAVVVRDNGYDPLTAEDLERIEEVSSNAPSSSSGEFFTVDPNLPDTDIVVDLRVHVIGSEETGFVPEGGTLCARVLPGND